MPGAGSFQAKRQRATGESSGCCKMSNILLFLLIGFVMFYAAVGVNMYLGQPASPSKGAFVSDAVGAPDNGGRLRGGSLPPQAAPITEAPWQSTVAADGIDDAVTAVVQCSTSQGDLTIDVRGHWAPIGAKQFLTLIENGLFTDLPFFRVCPRYITQFGPKYGGGNYHIGRIEDDRTLWGKRDMNFGYVFFAGSGKNSRGDQMVVALCETKGCVQTTLGKADWEVPVGTIRREGFEALRAIARSGKPYPRLEMPSQAAGAGGPDQGRMYTDKNYLKEHYPFMEYWHSCSIVERDIYIARPLEVDYGESFHII